MDTAEEWADELEIWAVNFARMPGKEKQYMKNVREKVRELEGRPRSNLYLLVALGGEIRESKGKYIAKRIINFPRGKERHAFLIWKGPLGTQQDEHEQTGCGEISKHSEWRESAKYCRK